MSFEQDIFNKNRARVAGILSNFREDQVSEAQQQALLERELEKGGKKAQIGEIRTHGGKKMQKTANGWRPVKESSGKSAEKHPGYTTKENGTKESRNSEGKLHSFNDEPATIQKNNTKQWFKNGQLHREDGPAIETADGTKHWYQNGVFHREDGPAIESTYGPKMWFKNGLSHREDGPAYIDSNGHKEWRQNDKLHREDGPAVEEKNGNKHWYQNGQLHREDGPAIVRSDGTKEYYLDGKKVSANTFNKNKESFEYDQKQLKSDFESVLGRKIKLVSVYERGGRYLQFQATPEEKEALYDYFENHPKNKKEGLADSFDTTTGYLKFDDKKVKIINARNRDKYFAFEVV